MQTKSPQTKMGGNKQGSGIGEFNSNLYNDIKSADEDEDGDDIMMSGNSSSNEALPIE